ncbi:MAG: YbhB/YbcL family Raf kinase inhibitor-like protein [Candidatus Aenigmarchaeota archaeon]|nr:YbhB/YbcL family Raf kinase inhibitor-like protein [Candidatus Aenigmarchaeota archaeon]
MKFSFLFVIIAVVGIVAISGCTQQGAPVTTKSPTTTSVSSPTPSSLTTPTQTTTAGLSLTSSAFSHNGDIPVKYTCDGGDVSPPLKISGVPATAKSLALIVDDPDAVDVAGKVWDHWVVFNIDPSTIEIGENQKVGTPGSTSSGISKYEGPCPPAQHSYSFRLYTLDKTLDLQEGATKTQVESAMQGSILAQTELIGKYGGGTSPSPTSTGFDSTPFISSSKLSPSNPGVNETFILELTAEDDQSVRQFTWTSSKPLLQGQTGYFDCGLQKTCTAKLELAALEQGDQKITVYAVDSFGKQSSESNFNLNVGPPRVAGSLTPTASPTNTTSPTTSVTTAPEDGCNSNSDCGYKQRCSAGSCIDVDCTTDSQCSGCKRCSSYSCVSCGKGPYGCYC